MNRLLIVGAGGLGREVLSWALQVPADRRDWVVGGVLDWQEHPWAEYGFPVPILGSPDDFVFGTHDRVVIALGDPRRRLAVAASLARRGALFTSVAHPSVIFGEGVRHGVGLPVSPLRSGEHQRAHGKPCARGCARTDRPRRVAGRRRHGSGVRRCDRARDHRGVVRRRSHAVILPGLSLAADAVVGAGAVVTHSVLPGITVVGVPARPVGHTIPAE